MVLGCLSIHKVQIRAQIFPVPLNSMLLHIKLSRRKFVSANLVRCDTIYNTRYLSTRLPPFTSQLRPATSPCHDHGEENSRENAGVLLLSLLFIVGTPSSTANAQHRSSQPAPPKTKAKFGIRRSLPLRKIPDRPPLRHNMHMVCDINGRDGRIDNNAVATSRLVLQSGGR